MVDGAAWAAATEPDVSDVLFLLIKEVADATGMSSFPFSLNGDFNSDGNADLLVSSPQGEVEAAGGVVSVFYGHADMGGTISTETADSIFTGEAGYLLGYTAVEALDFDGDGTTELLAGAPGQDPDGGFEPPWTGALYVLNPQDAW